MDGRTDNTDTRGLLEDAYQEIKYLHSQLETWEQASIEPIAIIGIGCRFPGGVTNPETFWQLLHNGVNAISEVPADRWDIEKYYDPDPDAPGKTYTRHGGFINNVDRFDPQFFGISPREATNIDPQQRLLLEIGWEAIEHAGIAPDRLNGSQTGVFIGVGSDDYSRISSGHDGGIADLDAYFSLGNSRSVAVGRLSYVLGLQGPNIQLDTACASSLQTVHIACQSLRDRECDLALAGGVNLMLAPHPTVGLSKLKALSTTGACKTFDATADGYTRGEGCGIVVLKRLSDAIAAGDRILALVRGSATNHDGRGSGMTIPNGAAQEDVIRQALENAGVQPADIQYVEAHGTGTPVGDPIEAIALGNVFSKGRKLDESLVIGSVKTNIGHPEAAAGIAGLIKVILSLQHQQIPPHLHLKNPNPHIPWEKLSIVVPAELTDWPAKSDRRLAGVNAFGISGSNVHLVVEQAPNRQSQVGDDASPNLITLSAKSKKALKAIVANYQNYLNLNSDVSLEDICFTANTGRAKFNQQLTIVTSSKQQLFQQLDGFLQGEKVARVVSTEVNYDRPPHIAFLFTGQGSQFAEMGRKLYETQPVFRQTLDRCDEILRPYLNKSILQIIHTKSGSKSLLDQTNYTQPALFAIEYSLYQLWRSWGIEPTAVMGHSLGEYVAACVAGVFSLEDGLKLIANRARLMQSLPVGGGMVAVLADEEVVRSAIKDETKISIAAVNSPKNTVISGDRKSLQEVVKRLECQDILTRSLAVSHAFHSHLMEPILWELEKIATEVNFSIPQIDLVSNLTGELVTNEICQPQYWANHLRQPILFANGMLTLQQLGYEAFVEVGPQPILIGMGRQCMRKSESKLLWLSSLDRGDEENTQILESLVQLYHHGVKVDWGGFHHSHPHQKVSLPTYPFQRKSYWLNTSSAKSGTNSDLDPSAISIRNSSLVIDYLKQGSTKELYRILADSDSMSTSELAVLPKMLDLLVRKHQQQVMPGIEKLLYQVEWREQSQPESRPAATLPGLWIILCDRDGIGRALIARLERDGYKCLAISTDWLKVDSTVSEWDRLFQKTIAAEDIFLQGIIHLWNLDTSPSDELDTVKLDCAQHLGCKSLLQIVQSLSQTEFAQVAPRIWTITKGAVSIGESPERVAVAQTPVWGMGKVIASEHRRLWGGLIDIDPSDKIAPIENAEQLWRAIERSREGNGIALRDCKTYVTRLVPCRDLNSRTLEIEADGIYLITGGLGVLGLHTARWLIAKGARHLALIGRSAPSTVAQESIEQMKQSGVHVLIALADVTNEAEVKQVLASIHLLGYPLKGIIHAAGVNSDRLLQNQSWSEFATGMTAKVMGGWNLHQLTKKCQLDFFVCFSSLAGILGAPSQGSYSAANSFLDGLVQYRRNCGLPALSINWGPWADGGMASQKTRIQLEQLGIMSLVPQEGIDTLGYLMKTDAVQIAVGEIDWSVLKPFYEFAGRSLLNEIVLPQPSINSTGLSELVETDRDIDTGENNHDFSASDRAPQTATEKLLHQLWCEQLLLEPEEISVHDRFPDLGGDSLMALTMIEKLQRRYSIYLESSILLENQTISKLANWIDRHIVKVHLSQNGDKKSTFRG